MDFFKKTQSVAYTPIQYSHLKAVFVLIYSFIGNQHHLSINFISQTLTILLQSVHCQKCNINGQWFGFGLGHMTHRTPVLHCA